MSRLLTEKAMSYELLIEKETNAISVIAEANSKYELVVSFSGGKDSLIVLDLADRLGIKKAVFVDTTLEFPETIEYVKQLRDFFSGEIKIIRPKISFEKMIGHINFPSRRFRWCCDVFKNAPLASFAQENNLHGFLTGLRKNESFRRKNYEINDFNPIFKFHQINPILDWTDTEVYSYIDKYGLPLNPLYEHFNRIGCWMCPYKGKEEWDKIKKLKPDLVKTFEMKLEKIAEKLRIKDPSWFIKERGWTYYTFQTKKQTTGLITPCSAKNIQIFKGSSDRQIRRILSILPILSNDYFVFNKSIRINLGGEKKKKLQILIEKAINCVGCGTCISLCPTGALTISEGSLVLDQDRCNRCLKCLETTGLRGGCIMRNYNPLRDSIEQTKSEILTT